MEELARLFPSGGSEGDTVTVSFSSFWWYLVFLDLWLHHSSVITGTSPMCCLCLCFSSYDNCHIGLGPTLMTLFLLDYICRVLISKQGHVHRYQG
jgi:hypothetical protein